jgi:tetratricopeptide (TPR) repeat protein
VDAAADARAPDSSWSATDLLSGIAYAQLGQYEAAAALRRFRERLGAGACVGNLGYVFAVSGQRERALESLDACETQSRNPDPGSAANSIATIYAGLGDREQTLHWLEHAVETRPESGVYLAVDPIFRFLHAEPRFHVVLKKMRLDE